MRQAGVYAASVWPTVACLASSLAGWAIDHRRNNELLLMFCFGASCADEATLHVSTRFFALTNLSHDGLASECSGRLDSSPPAELMREISGAELPLLHEACQQPMRCPRPRLGLKAGADWTELVLYTLARGSHRPLLTLRRKGKSACGVMLRRGEPSVKSASGKE